MKKTTLLVSLFCYAFCAIGQNSIIIHENTPFATCNGGTIKVLFNTNGSVQAPFTVKLEERRSYYGYAGNPNYSNACNGGSSTVVAEASSGNLVNGTYEYLLDIPASLYTKSPVSFTCAVHPYYGPTYAIDRTDYYIRVESASVLSQNFEIKLWNQTCPAILGARVAKAQNPQNVPIQVYFIENQINSNNVYTYLLSDKYGSFANPTAIYPPASTRQAADASSVMLNLPSAVQEGTNYRIKISSSDPANSQETNSFAITGPLPVNFISFFGTNNTLGNQLNWQTSVETNSNIFEIQRSTDAKAFENIGVVSAKGNSSEQVDYQFIDNNPQSNLSFYRLKQIDLDGKFEFSKIISIKTETNFEPKVYPNPASNYFIVENTNNNHLEVRLLDVLGRVMVGGQKSSEAFIKIPIQKIGRAHV